MSDSEDYSSVGNNKKKRGKAKKAGSDNPRPKKETIRVSSKNILDEFIVYFQDGTFTGDYEHDLSSLVVIKEGYITYSEIQKRQILAYMESSKNAMIAKETESRLDAFAWAKSTSSNGTSSDHALFSCGKQSEFVKEVDSLSYSGLKGMSNTLDNMLAYVETKKFEHTPKFKALEMLIVLYNKEIAYHEKSRAGLFGKEPNLR
jgi:hypothetical protein